MRGLHPRDKNGQKHSMAIQEQLTPETLVTLHTHTLPLSIFYKQLNKGKIKYHIVLWKATSNYRISVSQQRQQSTESLIICRCQAPQVWRCQARQGWAAALE